MKGYKLAINDSELLGRMFSGSFSQWSTTCLNNSELKLMSNKIFGNFVLTNYEGKSNGEKDRNRFYLLNVAYKNINIETDRFLKQWTREVEAELQ